MGADIHKTNPASFAPTLF